MRQGNHRRQVARGLVSLEGSYSKEDGEPSQSLDRGETSDFRKDNSGSCMKT